MGMLSDFIHGAASAGADLYSKQALEDMRRESEIARAEAIANIAEAKAERLRAAGAERIKTYTAPVSETVAGAATAVDDNDNPTAPNAYTKERPATLGESRDRALQGGDLQTASMLQAMSNADDRAIALTERAERDMRKLDDAAKNNAAKNELAAERLKMFGEKTIAEIGLAGAKLEVLQERAKNSAENRDLPQSTRIKIDLYSKEYLQLSNDLNDPNKIGGEESKGKLKIQMIDLIKKIETLSVPGGAAAVIPPPTTTTPNPTLPKLSSFKRPK